MVAVVFFVRVLLCVSISLGITKSTTKTHDPWIVWMPMNLETSLRLKLKIHSHCRCGTWVPEEGFNLIAAIWSFDIGMAWNSHFHIGVPKISKNGWRSMSNLRTRLADFLEVANVCGHLHEGAERKSFCWKPAQYLFNAVRIQFGSVGDYMGWTGCTYDVLPQPN